MRGILIVVIAMMGAAAPADAAEPEPTIPFVLARFLTDGVVAPGDYRWMRGRFPGASADEVAAFVAASRLAETCAEQSRVAMRTKLAAMGQAFDPGIADYARPAACRQFVQLGISADVDWPGFSAALARVRPYVLGLLRATALAEDQVVNHGSFAEQLRTRTLGEQVLRYAWIESERRDGATADYTPLERTIHEGILMRALEDRDQANTLWLAGMVAAEGWPTKPKVGEDASRAAWLLVQHADADPAFQLTALRLMAPHAATGAVDPTNFAMLSDRVDLKLSGKQRYGTQWTCAASKRAPLPLADDTATTDRRRKAATLDTLAENAKRIDAMYGPCPPAG